MEVPRVGVKLEVQLQAYATTIAMLHLQPMWQLVVMPGPSSTEWGQWSNLHPDGDYVRSLTHWDTMGTLPICFLIPPPQFSVIINYLKKAFFFNEISEILESSCLPCFLLNMQKTHLLLKIQTPFYQFLRKLIIHLNDSQLPYPWRPMIILW